MEGLEAELLYLRIVSGQRAQITITLQLPHADINVHDASSYKKGITHRKKLFAKLQKQKNLETQ